MRLVDNTLLYSSRDLADFIECRYAVDLGIADLCDETISIERAVDSGPLQLLQERGNLFEAQYHENIKSEYLRTGKTVAEIDKIGDSKSPEECALDTIKALKDGVDLIYQPGLYCKPWHGYPDYLRKVDGHSRFGNFQYEVMDVKSSSAPRIEHVLQISLYSSLLSKVQSAEPYNMFLTVGDVTEKRFKYSDYSHYLASVISSFNEYVDNQQIPLADHPIPLKCGFCDMCKWRNHCNELRESADHVSIVAGVTNGNSRKLRDIGIETVSDLAHSQNNTVQGIGFNAFKAMVENAALLLKKRETGGLQVETKYEIPGRGFYKLPTPLDEDLFLSIKTDRTFPDRRLDFLFGIWDSKLQEFKTFWGHDHAEEKLAFEQTIDFITQRLIEHPKAYVYHYGRKEEDHLKSLAAIHSTREEEVDEILRTRRLVNLNEVARESINTSEPGYRLEELEQFFLSADRTALDDGPEDSEVLYSNWKQTRDQSFLDQIINDNQANCISMMQCRNWLVNLCPSHIQPMTSPEFDPSKRSQATRSNIQLLINLLSINSLPENRGMRELAAQLTMFHERDARPDWNRYHERIKLLDEELKVSADCIFGLKGIDIIGTDEYQYEYPEQEFKFKEGDHCVFTGLNAADSVDFLDECGEITAIDRKLKRISIRHPSYIDTPPETFSIAPQQPIPTHMLSRAVKKYVDSLIEGTNQYGAITRFLHKLDPKLADHNGGSILNKKLELNEAVLDVLNRLDDSVLFIQGPPGSGKTTLAGRMILELMKDDKKIGISSNSHRAINELLQSVETHAKRDQFKFKGVKKFTDGNPDSKFPGTNIVNIVSTRDISPGAFQLIAGTAWLFCNPKFDQQLDYLFVDEAGQVSLANLVSIGLSAKNIVLIGDQMQLSHPSPGIHPGQSGDSTLDYMLQGEDTVPDHKGLFLDTSYRMHPNICQFISEAVYESRLKAHEANKNQQIIGGDLEGNSLPSSGIHFIELKHSGRSQSSIEEADKISELFHDLRKLTYIDKSGESRQISTKDLMVVAPYNAQVNMIKEKLPPTAKVGTIDLFQGQEAPIVIISMTTSNKEDMPRHLEFLFSRNRLNVAISRAQCLAIVIANHDLLSVACNTIEQMGLVNVLCWARDYSTSGNQTNVLTFGSEVACLDCFNPNPTDSIICKKCENELI